MTGADQSLLGEDYQDAVGNSYSPLLIQPIIVLSADDNRIKTNLPTGHGPGRTAVYLYRGHVYDWP